MDKYTKSHTEQEHFLGNYKVQIKAEFNEVKYELEKRVSNSDLRLNMKALNDMLMIKFSQVEDMKQSIRDVIVFQKYFYPLQTQIMISNNLEQLEAAAEDANFQALQR